MGALCGGVGLELSAAEGRKETRFAAVHRLEACTPGTSAASWSPRAPPDGAAAHSLVCFQQVLPLTIRLAPGSYLRSGIEFRGLYTCTGGAVKCPLLQTLTEPRHSLPFETQAIRRALRASLGDRGHLKISLLTISAPKLRFCFVFVVVVLFWFGQGITERSNEKSLH